MSDTSGQASSIEHSMSLDRPSRRDLNVGDLLKFADALRLHKIPADRQLHGRKDVAGKLIGLYVREDWDGES